jgi:hypothetical protein
VKKSFFFLFLHIIDHLIIYSKLKIEKILLDAGRERIDQLELYIEKMREDFNSKKDVYLEEIKAMQEKLRDDH